MFQECCLGVFMISLENVFEDCDESDFRKYLGLYLNSTEDVCNAVCF